MDQVKIEVKAEATLCDTTQPSPTMPITRHLGLMQLEDGTEFSLSTSGLRFFVRRVDVSCPYEAVLDLSGILEQMAQGIVSNSAAFDVQALPQPQGSSEPA